MDPARQSTVRTQDGLRLHVERDEVPGAPVTVVFVHGFTAQLAEFDLQRDALRGRADVVLYDQRGHGRSDRGRWRRSTVDQLGRDLQAVLEGVAPRGPVVLFGHSMGGMTLMSWARQFPQQVGSQVVGAFLLATSAGDVLAGGAVGALVRLLTRLHLLRLYLFWLRLVAPLFERTRKRGTRAGRAYIRRYLFGGQDAGDPVLVDQVQSMLEATPLTTTAAFYPTFVSHDEWAGLDELRRVPTTVLCGSDDRLTPVRHSREMAARLGESTELVVVPGAGHSVNVTRPEIVDTALLRLLERVRSRAAA